MIALLWVVAVLAVEFTARKWIASRARAWTVSYGALLGAALLFGVRFSSEGETFAPLWGGVVLAVVGYSLGRLVLGDKPMAPPKDAVWWDLLSVGLVVPVTEELIWGGKVEPSLGVGPTTALFALKHPIIDCRWRRLLGLGLFWFGLAIVRAGHPLVALVLHVAVNASGVVIGHLTKKDQF